MIILYPSVIIAILYINQPLTQIKCDLTAMSFPNEAAQWESILDASCSPDAAQRVPALFRDVSPLTLRVRLDRWPGYDPTSNEEQFWVEVNGPCATDDLIWQLCYHLVQHPTDREECSAAKPLSPANRGLLGTPKPIFGVPRVLGVDGAFEYQGQPD
ncbi:hypothetical protein N7492_009728 [Penicillium capsulatum]|uniref:Uncharacterized protein n=1 Tax=Penicillium capsulatum TaxID=69766 RepID=A0A9W9HLU2_9EURO|nr:hypothetical protein N7492_009728 [Penicillium capsulatum]KAJ6114190.1 hypothetical protein N7512_007635 [Penicillium capsulatum]